MGFFEIFAGILAFFYSLVPSYGLAIILLTLTTRVVLLPLSIKQTRSMREMQVVQPEVKALQKKYKGDRQKLNEEMMKLYKEHGVNPLGGCLPLLLQLPVLFGLFYVIREPLKYLTDNTALAVDLNEKALAVHRFLGFRLDCTPRFAWENKFSNVVEDVSCGGNGIISALPYLLLLLAMGFTTWYQQKQMQATRGNDPQMQQMQLIGRIMPIFLVIVGFGFPAGVLIYWFTTNLWTIVQQRIILKAAPPVIGSGQTAAKGGKKGGAPAKGSGKTTPDKAATNAKATPAKAAGKASSAKGSSAKTTSKSTSAKGNGAPAKSKPHPSSKKKRR